MPKKITKTAAPGGGAVIETQEGAVETRFSPPQNVASFSDWTEAWGTDIGDFNSGTVVIVGKVIGNAGAQWTAIEVRAVGYIGSSPTVLGTWMLGGAKNTAQFPIEEGRTFDRISIEARLIVNGAPGAGALPPSEATVSCFLKLWG